MVNRWLILILLSIGCSGLQSASVPVLSPIVNKLDMYGTINGYPFSGVGVVPAAAKYDMRISSNADINLLTVQTCHRNFSAEDVITTGWFNSRRGFNYVWVPTPGIEDTYSCLIRIGSYNKSVGGQNAWAVVDIASPDLTLPAMNLCDGVQGQSHGASICQTKSGLIERLVFESPVVIAAGALTPECRGTLLPGGKIWEYVMALGECVVRFMEIQKPHRMHRHTTEGYNNVIYRGGK